MPSVTKAMQLVNLLIEIAIHWTTLEMCFYLKRLVEALRTINYICVFSRVLGAEKLTSDLKTDCYSPKTIRRWVAQINSCDTVEALLGSSLWDALRKYTLI